MSHSTNTLKNKQQKHPKVHFEQYLDNTYEPFDYVFSDSAAEIEAELLENSYFMRRRLRRHALRMRNRY